MSGIMNDRETADERKERLAKDGKINLKPTINEDFAEVLSTRAGRSCMVKVLQDLGYGEPVSVLGDSTATLAKAALSDGALRLANDLRSYSPEMFYLMMKENQL